MTNDTTTAVGFTLTGYIEADDHWAAVKKWLADAPLAVTLSELEIDGDGYDLQAFETDRDRWAKVKFTHPEGV